MRRIAKSFFFLLYFFLWIRSRMRIEGEIIIKIENCVLESCLRVYMEGPYSRQMEENILFSDARNRPRFGFSLALPPAASLSPASPAPVSTVLTAAAVGSGIPLVSQYCSSTSTVDARQDT